MASIYDFAPANTESVKDTDFSTNYGFNVMPNALGIPYEQDFAEGLYAYANAHKSPDMLKRAQDTFGENLVNKDFADFWVGEAIINQLQFPDVSSAYIAMGIPIPQEISDIEQLTTTLGRNVLDAFSKDYDTRQQTLATSAKRAAANYQKLLNATYQPSDLIPEHYKEIIDAYGYAPEDIYAAGRILNSRQDQSTLDVVLSTASHLGNAALAAVPRAGEALGSAIKGDFSQAAKRLFKSGAGIERNLDASEQYMANATASNLANDAKFLALANNPTYALQIAQSIYQQKEKERLGSITMAGRLLDKADEIIYDSYQSLADTAVTTAGIVDSALGNTPVDIRQSQRVAASMRDAKESARAEIQDQNGILGSVEAGLGFSGEIARFANAYTAVPAVASLFRDNAGRSFNAVADSRGNIPSSTSNLEVYGKASADAAINYGTRAIGMKSVPLLMNRGLTKIGVNSTLGHYIGTTAWTGLNFAVTVPAMDAGLRAAYDAVAVKDERLKNGYKSLQQLWNQDLPSLDHWLTSTVPAAIFGYTGTRNYYRAGLGMATKAQMAGLSPSEADSIRRNTPLEDQPQAIQQAITDKLQQNPQKAIDDAIANTQRIASEEEQKAAAQLGKRVLLDNARKSALQLRGLDITPGKDDNHINLLLGGHIDPVTAKYIPGTKTVELPKENAELYLGAIFNHSASNLASKIRNVFVRGKLIDAAQQNLQGQILIEAMLDPADFSKVVQKGQQAQSRIDQITKDLIEKSKDQDGKPTLSESDARSQAENTIDKQISPHPLKLQVTFGKEAAARIEQEAKQTRTQDPDKSFMSHAYVLTLNPNAPTDSRTRIFKIAYDASAREMTEEYAEQWLKDYMETTGADLTDTYRYLADLSNTVKDFNLTTLQQRAPQLHDKLQNGEIIDNLDASEIRELCRDITEAFSKLLLADLRSLAKDGKLPDFAQELYDTQELTLRTMESEMAYATAINDSRKYGIENQTALRLLGATVDEVSRILKSIAPPTKDTYTEAFLEAEQTYQNLLNNNGLTSEQVESVMAQRAKDAQDIAKQIKASDEERNATAIQAVKTAEALPENADKPHNQIVKEVNEKINAEKAQEIQESPAAQDDSASSNGKALQISDENGLVCHQAIVRIADLHLMPNFKTGSSEDTGEVHALTGDYHPDHDPIRILRRTDGSLMVISGRHRLAHAKRFNQETIAAYIYDETPEHNLAWAQLKDVEWNIKDNQATAQDIALLIRGELIDGVPPLNSKDMLQMGIIGDNGAPRKGTNAEQGYNVATQASEDVITALKNDQIDINQAEKLAISAPSDPYLQRIGLKAMLDGKSDRIATHEIDIEKDKLAYLKDQGVGIQLDLFGDTELDSTYDSFIKDYSFKKVNLLNRTIAAQKTANKIAKDKDFAQLAQGTGLRIDNAMRARSQKLKNKPISPQEQLLAWKHPYTNMDIIGDEINTAFAKAHPDEWAKMQARKAEQQAALDTIPADSDTPDLGNSVQGDTSNIAEFDFSVAGLQSWQIDPTLGLGSLGHFADAIIGKFAPVGVDVIDKQLSLITKAAARRINEIKHLHGKDREARLIAEMSALANQITQLLPANYRFGLEPYHEFINVYAHLRKHGDPDTAADSLPMAKWPEIMANSFRRQFDRLLHGKLKNAEESLFYSHYNELAVDLDLNQVRADLDRTRRKYLKEARNSAADLDTFSDEYKALMAQAREAAYQDVKARHQEAFETAYQALATIRADKLMGKYFDRVILKLNQYRKDRILAKINRALYSITPTKSKDGKPVRGTVSMDTYNTILTNYRLLTLTKAQKDTFEESSPDLLDKEPTDTIKVPTYDENGDPITLEVTLQQYETYASLESMSADQAAKVAETLGTLIATGKDAWQIQAEAEKQQITNFTQPIYDQYNETADQRHDRLQAEKTYISGGKGIRATIRKALTDSLNDAQLIDIISSVPALGQFRSVQEAIGRAHSYIETSEKQNFLNVIKSAMAACGHPNADPLNLTGEQMKALKNFADSINHNHTLTGNDIITLTTQAPDFTARHTETLRNVFKKRIIQVTRKKNYDPNELAAVLQHLQHNIPTDLFQEVWDKYGTLGNADLFTGDIFTAISNVFPDVKYGHLRNLNKTIKERAADSHQKWIQQNPPTSENITSLTRNEAAYRVLLCEQPDLADSLRQQGYTPQVIQKLKDFAGADMMQFAYTLRDLLNARLPQLREIYEATYGTPFPEVENYFRAFFDAGTKESNDAQLEGLAFGAGGKQNGGMRLFHTRIKHKTPIMPTMSVTHAFQLGMKQQDNLIAYTDPHTHRHLGDFLNKVLNHRQGNKKLIDAMHNAIGTDATAAVQEHVKNMYRIYGHADPFSSAANRLMSDLHTAASLALLTARVTSLGKNIVAIFNTLGGADISPLQWYKSFIRWATPTAKLIRSPQSLLKDPLIADRYKEWDTETYIQSIYQLANQKSTLNKFSKYAHRGLSIFGKFDRWATSKSAAICYDAAYRDMQKKHPNMSQADLHNYAINQVTLALGVKGQPMDFRQRPLASTYNSWRTAAFYFLGGEGWSTFGDCARLAIKRIFSKDIPREQRKRALQQFAAVWLTNGAVMSMLNLGFSYLLDDEEQWKKRNIPLSLLLGTISGPISGIAFLSNFASEALRQIDSDFYLPTPSYLPMADIGRTTREIKALFDSDKSAWDKTIGLNNLFRTLCFGLLAGTNRPTSTAGAITRTAGLAGAATSNVLDFFLRAGRAADERHITPMPARPTKGTKMSKQSRELNKIIRNQNADDNHPLNLLTR